MTKRNKDEKLVFLKLMCIAIIITGAMFIYGFVGCYMIKSSYGYYDDKLVVVSDKVISVNIYNEVQYDYEAHKIQDCFDKVIMVYNVQVESGKMYYCGDFMNVNKIYSMKVVETEYPSCGVDGYIIDCFEK